MIKKWRFWAVVKRFPYIITIRNELSLPDLNELYAIKEMEDDYEKAVNEYQAMEMDKMRDKK